MSFEPLYKDICLNCIRYLNYTKFEDIDRLTLQQYNLLMKGVQLKNVDRDYRQHLQAYLNFSVQATKKSGRPVYRSFKKFYDYEKQLDRVKNKKHGDKLMEAFRKGEKAANGKLQR